ncbi:MAG: hypothetical protein ACRDJL_10630 [Actinomycetota bacterium]
MNQPADHNLRRELGVSRREMLRRSAIAGGTLLWAAPVIQTLTPTLAQAGSMSVNKCCFCSNARRKALPPTQCINNGMPPNADACRAVCTGLGYRASSFCESKAPTSCTTATGCSCP